MSNAHAGLLLGLDIGGTKIGVCVGDSRGRVLASARVEVNHRQTPEKVLDSAVAQLDRLVRGVVSTNARDERGSASESPGRAARAKTKINPTAAGGAGRAPVALGCACPGPFDYRRGRFLNPPNNPGWHGFELGAYLRKRFDTPIAIMNDANAAVLAEWKWGAARGAATAIFLTMSTGMGSGLIVGGRLYEGPSGMAGEIGQIRLTPGDAGPVGFGKRGSAEGYCSGPGMQQMARAEALISRQLQRPTKLLDVLDRTGDISTRDLCELALAGDGAARRVTDRVALELGRLCGVMVDILNPNVIVLGTIGTAYPKLFIPGAMKVVRDESIASSARLVKIRASAFSPEERGDKQALAVAASIVGEH